MRIIILFFTLSLLCITTVEAQISDADKSNALQLVSKNSVSIGLSPDDLNNLKISNTYYRKEANLRMVYLLQTLNAYWLKVSNMLKKTSIFVIYKKPK